MAFQGFARAAASRRPVSEKLGGEGGFLRLTPLTCPGPPGAQSPFAASERYALQGGVPHPSTGVTLSSSLLRAHAPDHNPPPAFRRPHVYPVVCAGCCQPLLGDGLSRRSLRASFPACVDPSPVLPLVPMPVSSQGTSAFTVSGPARRSTIFRTATSVRAAFQGCSHSLMVRPAGLLATQVTPTAVLPLGSRGLYVRAECMLLPSCTSDMLPVRIGQ
jgi:hypothetical protein